MITREEHKYFLPLSLRSAIIDDLRKFTSVDQNAVKNGGFYTVASIYYDNIPLTAYFDKLNGIMKRLKLRVRYYVGSTNEQINLEMKYKIEDRIFKKVTQISPSMLSHILDPLSRIHSVALKDEVVHEFQTHIKANELWPFIRVDYKRIPLSGRIDKNVRITIDEEVECNRYRRSQGLMRAPHISVFAPGTTILEIKLKEHFPYWLTYLVKKYSLKREAISKYLHSVQQLAINSSLSVK